MNSILYLHVSRRLNQRFKPRTSLSLSLNLSTFFISTVSFFLLTKFNSSVLFTRVAVYWPSLDFVTMSNHNSLPPRSPSSTTPPNNGSQAKTGLVPTNNVTTIDGLTVRARIDPTLTVADVVKQLCVNLKIKGSPSDFALRDENHELVTNENLRKKIKAKLDLK